MAESSLPRIAGATPGMLDETQPLRVLRDPAATLSFASFHPLTASASDCEDAKTPHPTGDTTRIVLERLPSGETTWRFVPKAKRADWVVSEGSWPQEVNFCGTIYVLDEDQWNMHKLDPYYECYVPSTPDIPVIRVKPSSPKKQQSPQPTAGTSQTIQRKRRRRSSEPTGPSTKKQRKDIDNDNPDDSDDSDLDDEIVEMSIDPPQASAPKTHLPGHRKINRPRPKSILKKRPQVFEPVLSDAQPMAAEPTPPPPVMKRKGSSPEPAPGTKSAEDAHYQPSKRARTQSPDRATQAAKARERHQRLKSKFEDIKSSLQEAHEEGLKRLQEELLREMSMPEETFAGGSAQYQDTAPEEAKAQTFEPQSESEDGDDAEAAHEALLAESRAKLAELERDRPLWEQQRRQRELQEQQERAEERARAEARQRVAQEELNRRRREAAEREMRRRENEALAREEMLRQHRAQQERRRREQEAFEEFHLREARRRQFQDGLNRAQQHKYASQQGGYSSGSTFGGYGHFSTQPPPAASYTPPPPPPQPRDVWTTARALERYNKTCDAFDDAKYTAESPLLFDSIPWPMLLAPGAYSHQDITWHTVEEFFKAVRKHMREQDFKVFVEKSHRRFHPDRWSSRGLLKSVVDEVVREQIDKAANVVAQALTPVWRETKNR